MTTLNTTTAANSSTQLSVERQLAELIDEVRVSVGPQATLAAKVSFNPKETLNKFNNLIEKAINNIQEELKQAVTSKSSQAIIDDLNKQLNLVTERATTFRNYLNGLSSSTSITRSANSEQGNVLSAWLDEVSPLAEPEDLTEMPFQSLKADRTNVPHDFSTKSTTNVNIKTRDLKNIDDFFLPEYIASANETEITDDILAKAKELSNSPVKIYEWVRNNVEWQPTWGGQQTADMTLDVCRGNAMDISTLMIALLRAAKIPARYVHGTVDIPADNFINMAGDFENVDAAIDFISAGGIPVTSVTVGGKIAKVRIEHVWVEAAVPFYPSRGAKPVSARNPIDSWIPLDGSFKQYKYLKGIDTLAISKIDSNKVINDFKNSGSSDEQEGWVQGGDIDIIENALQESQANVNAYINTMQTPTVGSVVGGRTIIVEKFNMLPGTLPYLAIVRGISYTKLSASLQVQVTLKLGYDRTINEFQQQKTWPLYKLNQQNISISFRPASTEDENRLDALIPADVTSSTQLPSFLPSSIHVIPEVRCDDTVLLSSGVLTLGDMVDFGYHFHTPTQSYLNKKDQVVAGSYLALGIVGSNLSKKTFLALDKKLNATKDIIDKKNKDGYEKLSREQLIGDMFVTGVLGYYNQYTAEAKLTSLRYGTLYHAMPTAGTVGYEPYQRTLFGLNRGIDTYGLFVNVRIVQILAARDGNNKNRKAFNNQLGLLSSMIENITLEQMANEPDHSKSKVKGFSAVSAISLAISQGQKIFHITQANQHVLGQLNLDVNAITEIRNAIANNKEVFTHVDQIVLDNYRGCGYIIIDPNTGDGSYKISGGKNGATIGLSLGVTIGLAITSIKKNPGSTVAIAEILVNPITIVILSSLTLLLSIFSIMDTIQLGEQKTVMCFLAGLNAGLFNTLGLLYDPGKALSALLALIGFTIGEYAELPTLRSCGVLP